MRIAILGAHGQIARQLTRDLTARGDDVVGIVRDDAQHDDVRDDGGEPATHDVETGQTEALADVIRGCDAVVFAAGAGGGSGKARKETVDLGGAVQLRQACELADVDRYVMVSSMGTDTVDHETRPGPDADVFAHYLWAKAAADADLAGSDLRFTIVRPGSLTDDAPTGRVSLTDYAAQPVAPGSIPRGDVAALLAEVLHDDTTVGAVLGATEGPTPLARAVASLAS